MVKKIFLAMSFMITTSILANNEINFKRIDGLKKNLSLDADAQILSILGSKNDIKLKEIKIGKPSKNSLKLIKLVTPRDKYAIRILNEKNKEIMLIGIGNPFYIHADHIGYENSHVHGGYINKEFKIPLSLDTKASQIILLSQDEFGFKEIKRLVLN